MSSEQRRKRTAEQAFGASVENHEAADGTTSPKLAVDEGSTPLAKQETDPQFLAESLSNNKPRKRGLVLGQGDVGQLGLGDSVLQRKRPAYIRELGHLKQIVCGGMHTVALTEKHEVFSWGCNDDCALGRETGADDVPENTPGLVPVPKKFTPIMISAGDSHTAVLTECGTVLVCGVYRSAVRKIGLVKEDKAEKRLVVVYQKTKEKRSQAVAIASGNDHLLILTDSGKVLSCGSADQGQLGRVARPIIEDNGGRRGVETFLRPAQVPFLCYTRGSKRIKRIQAPMVDIVCGSFHSFAIDEDGHVYGWGLNNYGQLGFANLKEAKLALPTVDPNSIEDVDHDCRLIYRPMMIGGISYMTSKENHPKIAAGQHHTIFIDTLNHKVFGLGKPDYGRLGIGNEFKRAFFSVPQPADLSNLDKNKDKPIKVACGEVTSFIVGDLGNLYSYGVVSCLQLSVESEDDIMIPTKAIGKNLDECGGVDNVSSGGQHTTILVLEPSNTQK